MTELCALQQQLIAHLRHHLPAVQGHVYLAPQNEGMGTASGVRSRQSAHSVWLQGPSWQRNSWASCVPGQLQQQGNRFSRTHAPLAWDLLYDVLVFSRCTNTLNTIATQLCSCVAHACSMTVLPGAQHNTQQQIETAPPQKPRAPQSLCNSYELVWEGASLFWDGGHPRGWHTVSGRLKIEGVLLYSDAVAETGPVSSKPVRLRGPRAGHAKADT